MEHNSKTALAELLAYCRQNEWAGYDPYDALNSVLFQWPVLRDSRLIRLAATQLLKRSRINVRPLLGIRKTQNAKAIALFISALLKAPELCEAGAEDLVESLAETLIGLRAQDSDFYCWGYSFPWQTRTIVVPRGAANLVCTTFAAQALLDLYEQRNEARCLSMAASAAEYILSELYWTDGGEVAGFGYPLPEIRNQVHNANFLAAAVLCRVCRHTGDPRFLEPAMRATRCSVARQQADGSWFYGEAPTQHWIDNFHTGYNLCALRSIARDAGSSEFDRVMEKGFAFYRTHFFREDGAPKYFHDRTYPIDIHAVAQSIITLARFSDADPENLALAHRVQKWAMDHLWDERGFFCYRVTRMGRNRTSFMRWSQAWMLLALAELEHASGEAAGSKTRDMASAVTVC